MIQFEMRFPYYILETNSLNEIAKLQAHDIHVDLPFLEPDTGTSAVSCIYRAQFSLVIYGLSNWRWVAHSFDNRPLNGRFDLAEETYSYEHLQEGPIAADIMDTNTPIQDPQVYLLYILRARLDRKFKE